MNWRSLSGNDLAGKLSAWKRRYKGNLLKFDHRDVWCNVTQWSNGKCTVSASAYCNDPISTGVEPIAHFYSSRSFHSRIEAEAHLEAEIRRATKKHPKTKFYRERACLVSENGKVTEPKIEIAEFCQGGQWFPAENVPSHRRCSACGHKTEDILCPKCGEPQC